MRLVIVGALGLLTLVVTGCAGDPTPASPPAVPGATADSTAIGLVNLWRVSGVDDEGTDTWLRLDAPNFELWRDCGMILGSWRATDTLFLASVYGASGECAADGSIPSVDWLETVTGFQAAGGGWELVEANGAVVATLTIDGKPDPIPTAVESLTEPPPITGMVTAALRRPVTLPEGLTPVAARDLTGRWVPATAGGSTDPHVLFESNGSWTASDGCNSNQGRWTVDETGVLLSTSGPSTAMGCEGAPVPTWVYSARLAALDADDRLLLLDADGTELGRLVRG